MKKGRFLWSAHRITERQKAGKARSIKGKQLKNSRSTDLKQLVELHSSLNVNYTFSERTISKRIFDSSGLGFWGVSNLNFNYMDAYVIMITYFLRKMGETKTSCKQFVASYQQQTEYLRNELPIGVCNQILGTQHRSNINTLQKFISKS